jgi:hypothetical protein
LAAATATLIADAAALAAAVTAAESAKTAYVAAGGVVTDAVYVAVTSAVTSAVTADIVSATTALAAATATLIADAAALAAAVTAAEAAQVAHLAAPGGAAADTEYVAVQAALAADPRVTADIVSATATLATATDALVAITVVGIVAYDALPQRGHYITIELSPAATWNNPSTQDFQVYGVDSNAVETLLTVSVLDVWSGGFGAGFGVSVDGIGMTVLESLTGYATVRVIYTKNSSRLFQGSGKTLQSFDLTGAVV